jgi:hypothetical protein
MKKSELKNFIRESIIDKLMSVIKGVGENTDAEIEKTKELTAAIKDLEVAKKEAGIEEKVAKSVDDVIDPADYGLIGSGYLKGFNRPHSLDADQLETLGRKIVKQLYKGDFDKAKAKFIKEEAGIEEANVGLDDLQDIGYDDGEYAVSMHFNKDVIGINNPLDYKYYRRGFLQGVKDSTASYKLEENEDKEPSKADLKKTKGLAKAKEELALLTREMKSLAKKYSKAEGEEKEKLVADLKKKTKLKKELEKILDK